MARSLRLLFIHAIYHVINRGNYRHPIFESEGARKAFIKCLFEAAERYGWVVHAYVLMNNHFHLAIETPRANLSEGMQWLESTFATRFNRFRHEHGHVFQGRFKAQLVEPGVSLARVVNYIHLNPVKAGLVSVECLPGYRWSSLPLFLGRKRPDFLSCSGWLKELGLEDVSEGWSEYQQLLADLAADPERQKREGFDTMTVGWAIGRKEWCAQIASEFRALPILEAPYGPERDAIREAEWRGVLTGLLQRLGSTLAEARNARKGAPWKVAIAEYLRRTTTATNRWIARELRMGSAGSVRTYLSQVARGRRHIDRIS